MKFLKLIGLSFMLMACSSSQPKRDFTVTLYETDAVCIRFLDGDGNRIIICDDDDRWPKDLIGITIEDYNKERGYQDLLIRQCRKWK
jgi:hypothetical protein